MKKISIIVPVYNSEKFLKGTISALQKSIYENIEIITVDDGSSDNSEKIIKQIQKSDDRIKYVNISNGGPGKARNKGIEIASGDYICFCDADDLPDSSMYLKLKEGLEESNADIALCDIYSERDNKVFGFPWKKNVFKNNSFYEEFIPEFIGNKSDNTKTAPVWGSVVRCLYKRDIITKNNVSFPKELFFAEDLVFTLRYLSHSKSAYVCYEPLYRYVWNRASIMNSYTKHENMMLEKRLKLVEYITDAIQVFPNKNDLINRLRTTERCYYHECIGNACRQSKERGFKEVYGEIKNIVKNSIVKRAFSEFDAKELKKRLIYTLIAKKMTFLLWGYYRFRLH